VWIKVKNIFYFLSLGMTVKTLFDEWDASIQVATWMNDGQSLFLELGERGIHALYQALNVLTANPTAALYTNVDSHHDVNVHPTDNQTLVLTYDSFILPTNIALRKDNADIPITDHNYMLIGKTQMGGRYEAFSFEGAGNETVWGWHLEPMNGTGQKAPLAFLIHGGPQNSWYNAWGRGWSFQTFASQGYAVIAINFHGSDSYGQNFTDSITGEYGTLPYDDLQLGLTAALDQYKYIDETRAIALGASYGGYMINWIAGHPEMSQRFRALVCHDGLFDMREMAYATEELWFTEHDAGNVTQYEDPQAYEKFNPINHVANWSQPMLIIQGGRDYRVPDTQSIGAFTALQRRGIPSRMLYFPNENHWTLNPLNSLVWYQEVLDWMRKWTQ
jgi:dipeptidyl aminopeptidase/acylaminoacyl peptidase